MAGQVFKGTGMMLHVVTRDGRYFLPWLKQVLVWMASFSPAIGGRVSNSLQQADGVARNFKGVEAVLGFACAPFPATRRLSREQVPSTARGEWQLYVGVGYAVRCKVK